MVRAPKPPAEGAQTPSEGETDSLPFVTLVPNMVTTLGLCAGLTAIRFGFQGDFEAAVKLILVAVVLDGLQGGSQHRVCGARERVERGELGPQGQRLGGRLGVARLRTHQRRGTASGPPPPPLPSRPSLLPPSAGHPASSVTGWAAVQPAPQHRVSRPSPTSGPLHVARR